MCRALLFPAPQRDDNMTVEEVKQQVGYVALITKQASSVSDLRKFSFTAKDIQVRGGGGNSNSNSIGSGSGSGSTCGGSGTQLARLLVPCHCLCNRFSLHATLTVCIPCTHALCGSPLQAPVVYLRAAVSGVCTYMDDARTAAVPHGACWYDMCPDLEVIDVPGDHFSILRQVRGRGGGEAHYKLRGMLRTALAGWLAVYAWVTVPHRPCSASSACGWPVVQGSAGTARCAFSARQLQPSPLIEQDLGDMNVIVTALKQRLGPFGWTEAVKREAKAAFAVSAVSADAVTARATPCMVAARDGRCMGIGGAAFEEPAPQLDACLLPLCNCLPGHHPSENCMSLCLPSTTAG